MNLKQQVISEFLGTMGLGIVVIGSGIMAENLAQGNMALALLANSIATGAGLYVLIHCCGPYSGAHFNPVVSLVDCLSRKLSVRNFTVYTSAQIVGGIVGVFVTHVMFGQDLHQLSNKDRGEFRFAFSEAMATFGLILVISICGKRRPEVIPTAASLYIVSAYWFTSSTSFANPALTIARALTDTFAGIAWAGVPQFILAQILGALLAFVFARKL